MNNPPIITVSNVSKHVGQTVILDAVSFTITETELVALIGPNGAGKSSLIKIILGLDTAYTGTATVSAHERVHYIPQITNTDPYQLPISVEEYLFIGTTPLYRRRSTPIDLATALNHVGVSPQKLPQTFFSLSGGERQRVAIARALLFEPTVLILDEPLAAVDYGARQGLYELLRHLQQVHRITMMLVSHDTDSVVPLCDRVLCLNKTLHTDCHPTLLPTPHNNKEVVGTIHHHC